MLSLEFDTLYNVEQACPSLPLNKAPQVLKRGGEISHDLNVKSTPKYSLVDHIKRDIPIPKGHECVPLLSLPKH